MASLLPVHIDPEEIQRQSFYLSQTRYVLNFLIGNSRNSWFVLEISEKYILEQN